SYFARTVNSLGFFDEVYDNIPCHQCDPTTGTPIQVPAFGVAAANFALAPGGIISGTIFNTSTSAPVSGVTVSVYQSTGTFVNSFVTDASGFYTSAGSAGLAPGSYVARTFNSSGLIDELYNDIVCLGLACDVKSGTPIGVTALTTTTVNFGLTPGGHIS